ANGQNAALNQLAPPALSPEEQAAWAARGVVPTEAEVARLPAVDLAIPENSVFRIRPGLGLGLGVAGGAGGLFGLVDTADQTLKAYKAGDNGTVAFNVGATGFAVGAPFLIGGPATAGILFGVGVLQDMNANNAAYQQRAIASWGAPMELPDD